MNSRRKTRLSVDAKQGMITISGQPVHLKPLEFVYYRMFVERYLNGEGAMSVTSIEDRRTLLDRLIHLHRESFPDADAARQDMEIQLRKVEERKPLKNFRPTISKINAKLKRLRLGSRPPIIESAGQYGAKHFRVNLEEYKVSIEAPTVSPTFASQIRTYTPNDYLATVLKEMHKKNFSQVVVISKGKLKLLTIEGISRWLAAQASKGMSSFAEVKLSRVLSSERNDSVVFMNPAATIREAHQTITQSLTHSHPLIHAILITESGTADPPVLGIITPWDFIYRNHW